MTYDDLALFTAVVDEGHFGRAARQAHVSVSTLTRAIQRVERQAGARLLDRDRSGVRLTRAGEAVDRHARSVLSGWDSVRHGLAGDDVLSGTLRLYCTVTAAQSFVPDLLARFRAAYPAVRLDLETGYAADAVARLQAGEVDVAVAGLAGAAPKGIAALPVASTPLRFVAPVGYGRVDWRRAPLVLPAHGLAREEVDRWFRRRRVQPNVVSEVEGHEAVLSLVAMGVGIGVVPGLVVEGSALRGRVEPVATRPALPVFHIGVCVRQRSLDDPVCAAFWSTVTDRDKPP